MIDKYFILQVSKKYYQLVSFFETEIIKDKSFLTELPAKELIELLDDGHLSPNSFEIMVTKKCWGYTKNIFQTVIPFRFEFFVDFNGTKKIIKFLGEDFKTYNLSQDITKKIIYIL